MSDIDVSFKRNNSPEDRLMFGQEAEVPHVKPHDLDSEDMVILHKRLCSFYQQELSRQQTNRFEQAIDEDFYDNIQWTDEDAQILRDRGQTPICYNVIATSVNWLINSQKRMRTDFKILPRKKAGGKQAELKTNLIKYLNDVNRTQFDVSRAFEDAVKVGIGWLEDGCEDDAGNEPVYSRYESWRNMLWDSAGSQKDTTDWRYIILSKHVDVDIAAAIFPDRAGIIDAACAGDSTYSFDMHYGDEAMDAHEDSLDNRDNGNIDVFGRRRVRLIEVWFKTPKNISYMKGGQFSGEVYDPTSRGHTADVEAGHSVVAEKTLMRMHCAVMTTSGLLWFSESPYRHNDFPFTPVFGNKRGRDGMPYGVIRSLRDIQEDINRRASKALAILSSNKVIMDEGAVEDINEFIEENSRPDAVLIKKQGKELVLNVDRELAPTHLELMSRSISIIQQVGGITDENMGRTTNATSGVAIQARQDQGALSTYHFFDNLKLARQLQGEKQLSLIEQYFDEEKQFRITNQRGTPQYITVNDGSPESDIALFKADFVISEQDWNSTVRAAQLTELLAVMQQIGPVAPNVVLAMLDLVVEGMDIASREELVKRIRAITGQRDPDQEELTPEEQAQAQAQQAQQQMQQRAFMADVAVKEATAQERAAKAQETQARVQKLGSEIALSMSQTANMNVNTQIAALQAAIAMLQTPNAVPVADSVLHESGFMSRSEGEHNAMIQQQMQQQQAQQAQQAQQEQMQQAKQQQAMQQQQQDPNQIQQPTQPA